MSEYREELQMKGIDLYSGLPVAVTVAGGVIARVDALPPSAALGLPFLCRGFVDIQVNGYRGVDYTGENLTIEGIRQLVGDLAAAGVLRHVPTLVTAPAERVERNLRLIREAVEQDEALRRAIPAIHLEGPYLSAVEGARGAHDPRFIRDSSINELQRWQQAAGGMIRLITLAPERPGAMDFIRAAVAMGIRVAIGHCLPAADEIAQAADAGATLSTHLGNGCPAVLPRLQNPIWQQLAEDRLTATVIADGFHLPDSVLKAIWRVKGPHRLALVSDVGPLGGLSPGLHAWGNMPVTVHPDGHLGLAGTDYLAGAGHLLDTCIVVFIRATGTDLRDCLPLVQQNPLRALGLPCETGPLRAGEAADVICVRMEQHSLRVEEAVSGNHVWSVFKANLPYP